MAASSSSSLSAAAAAAEENEENEEKEYYIEFQHKDNLYAKAVVVDTACKVLFAPDVSVLIVGEGNYTFATALAARRNGWKNIFVSQFPNEEPPNFSDTVNLTASYVAQNLSKIYNNLTPITDEEDNFCSQYRRDLKNKFPKFSDKIIASLMGTVQRTLSCMSFRNRKFKDGWEIEFDFILNLFWGPSKAINNEPLTDFHKKQLKELVSIWLAPKYECLQNLELATIIEKTEADVIELGSHEEGWLTQRVDAKCLPMFRLNENPFFPRAVIFQCPYDDVYRHSGALIKGLFDSANMLQSPPEYIFIGIANKFPYTKYYRLEWLLGIRHKTCYRRSDPHYNFYYRPSNPYSSSYYNPSYYRHSSYYRPQYTKYYDRPIIKRNSEGPICSNSGYEFLGADDDFPANILAYGYKHECNFQGGLDLHDYIFFNHVMLCFKRKCISEDNDNQPKI